DVEVQPGAHRELAEEAGDDVAGKAADPLTREVDVRGDVRLVGDLEHGAGECLVGRQPGPAPAGGAGAAEERRERVAEAAAGGGHLLVDASGRDLEREAQTPGPRELADQVVEDRQAGADGRAPFGRELDAHACLRPGHLQGRVPTGRDNGIETAYGRTWVMGRRGTVVATCAIAVALLAAPGVLAARGVSVGYDSPGAVDGLHVLAAVPSLHVAEVAASDVTTLRGRPGIRWVRSTVARRHLGVSHVTARRGALAAEWQFAATRANLVPA